MTLLMNKEAAVPATPPQAPPAVVLIRLMVGTDQAAGEE